MLPRRVGPTPRGRRVCCPDARLVRRSLETGFDAALDLAQDALTRVRLTEDAKEGPKAFAEKRKANWKNR